MLYILPVLVHALQTPLLKLLHLALYHFEMITICQQKLSLVTLDDLLDLLIDPVHVFEELLLRLQDKFFVGFGRNRHFIFSTASVGAGRGGRGSC